MLHIPPCTCARGVSLLVVRMKKHHHSREVIFSHFCCHYSLCCTKQGHSMTVVSQGREHSETHTRDGQTLTGVVCNCYIRYIQTARWTHINWRGDLFCTDSSTDRNVRP